MKKKIWLILAAVLALGLYFRPLSFPELSFFGDGDFSVQKVDFSTEFGNLDVTNSLYSISEGSPEAEAIEDILERYSYHRCFRTIFPNTDLIGMDAGFTIFLWGGNLSFNSSGTGEIVVNDQVYRMGLLGNLKNQAFMEELATVLAEAEPVETLS